MSDQHPVETIRRRLGLTQQQLADKLGVTRQHVLRVEGGKCEPSPMMRYAMAAVEAGLEPIRD